MKPGLFRKLLSYFAPQMKRVSSTPWNRALELSYFSGAWELNTPDAQYSHTTAYRPLRVAFHAVEDKLPAVGNILVLGTGLASAVHLLYRKGYTPKITLVELDETILAWAMELLPEGAAQNITPVCGDAKLFLEHSSSDQYDMVIVDIFNGRYIPEFVLTDDFFKKCHQVLHTGGTLIFNCIANTPQEAVMAVSLLEKHFSVVTLKKMQENRIFIATA